MYPVQALVDGLYGVNDLPDSIILRLLNQSLPGPEFCPEEVLFRSNDDYLYGYGDPNDSSPGATAARISYPFFSEEAQGWFFRFDQVKWETSAPPGQLRGRVYLGGYEAFCLLADVFLDTFPPRPSSDDFTKDQFADTYTVSGNPDYNQIIERTSLYLWDGPGNPSGPETNISVFYLSCIENEDLKKEYPNDLDAWFMAIGGTNIVVKKSGNQNSPAGSYEFPLPPQGVGTLIVS
jgi:hypothetical protein